MSRKSEPPDEGVAARRSPTDPLDAFGRGSGPEEAEQRRDEQRADARLQQVQAIRRFVHDRARALHVLAARLVGPRDAATLACEAISHLGLRVRQQSPEETRATSPDQLWRLTCMSMAYAAYDHLGQKRAGSERDGDPLERAHQALSPAERILYVFHYYYRFSDRDFEEMFHLSKVQSRRLVYRALGKLKRAMREQRAKQ